MTLKWDGRECWAVVLGARSGFGAAAAKAWARQGFGIIGVHLDLRATKADAEAVRDEIAGMGVPVHFFNTNAADDAKREQIRHELHEPYRSLLGHFRHEVGHYYWDRLIRDTHWLEPFRELFGDERQDYAAAIKANYDSGPPAGWRERHISAYASSHPWEDWAETWAHYLHIVDSLDTAIAVNTAPVAAASASRLP